MVAKASSKPTISAEHPAPLSSGAAQAFSTVLFRILHKDYGTPAFILHKSSSVRQVAEQERKERTARRQERLSKHRNHVIGDITTNRERERQLKITATKGVVAMFQAIAKAKKEMNSGEIEEKNKKKVKAKEDAVSREGFLDLIRQGVNESNKNSSKDKEGSVLRKRPKVMSDSDSDSEDDSESDDTGPGWAALKDDYLTTREKNTMHMRNKKNSKASHQEASVLPSGSDSSHDEADSSSEGNA